MYQPGDVSGDNAVERLLAPCGSRLSALGAQSAPSGRLERVARVLGRMRGRRSRISGFLEKLRSEMTISTQ